MASDNKKIEIKVISTHGGDDHPLFKPPPQQAPPSTPPYHSPAPAPPPSSPAPSPAHTPAPQASAPKSAKGEPTAEEVENAQAKYLHRVKLNTAAKSGQTSDQAEDIQSRIIRRHDKWQIGAEKRAEAERIRLDRQEVQDARNYQAALKAVRDRQREENYDGNLFRIGQAARARQAEADAHPVDLEARHAIQRGIDFRRQRAAARQAEMDFIGKNLGTIPNTTKATEIGSHTAITWANGVARAAGGAAGAAASAGGAAAGAAAALGPAAIAAAAAVAALAVGAAAAVIAMKEIDEVMKGLVRSAEQFHGPLAATVATVEVQRLQAEMHRAQVLGGDLTNFARARGDISLAFDSAITNLLQPILPHIVEATEKLAAIATIIATVTEDPSFQAVWKALVDGPSEIRDLLRHVPGIGAVVNQLDKLVDIAEELRRLRGEENIDIIAAQQALLSGRIAPSFPVSVSPFRGRGMNPRRVP